MGDPTAHPAATWQRAVDRAGRHQRLVDAGIAALIAAASLVGLAIQGRIGRHPATAGFCLALCLPLLLRSRSPALCFASIAGVGLAQWLLSTPQIADAAVLVALYWVARDGGFAQIALAATVTEAGAVMAAVRWSPTDVAKYWIGLSGLGVAAGVLGVSVRQRRALVASLHERAVRLEFERDQEGRLGAAAERARIAREMHDIVSHNLTVMIGLADGAAYALPSFPETASEAIARVSSTGRQALDEMRRLLGVLRDEPDAEPFAPQPGLDRLDELLARVEAAGIPVGIDVTGDPHGLPGGVQLTVFRVAQEALTNTLKHAARPVAAHLALRCQAGRVELEVTDTGASGPVVATDGRGLAGMRERAAAYGGTLDAGPRPEGGWRVALTLTTELTAPARR